MQTKISIYQILKIILFYLIFYNILFYTILKEYSMDNKIKKIVIVEDESLVAEDLKGMLLSLKYQVAGIFSSGEDLINFLKYDIPDIILMDVRIKGDIDGIKTADRIMHLNIPVLFITAYCDEETLHRAKLTEPYGYILKPFTERELFTNIEIALYKNKMEKQLEDSERWISAILNSIGDAIIATDSKGYIKFMNPTAEKLTGWKQDESKGKKMNTLFQIIEDKEVARNKVINSVDNIELSDSLILISRNGDRIKIHENATPIKDGSGDIIGIVLVFHEKKKRG